jgi:cobalt/nickel transport system permease protein
MHIPDGYLDPLSAAITYMIFLAFVILTYRKVGRSFTSDNLSLVTVLAASIFAAQMLNWPIVGGTSLHFVGGALAGIILGPYLGFVTMTLVLVIQCLIFHDGGITALGANVLNMGIIDVLAGYGMYKVMLSLLGTKWKSRILGTFLGGWIGITLAGLACGVEIGLSSSFGFYLDITVPVMTIWHAVLGIVEGVITALIIGYLQVRAPGILRGGGLVA